MSVYEGPAHALRGEGFDQVTRVRDEEAAISFWRRERMSVRLSVTRHPAAEGPRWTAEVSVPGRRQVFADDLPALVARITR